MSIQKNSNLVPAVCNILFSALGDIDTVENDPDRFHKTVSFQTGKAWQEIYFTPGTAEFNEKPKITDAGELVEQSLKFIFPGEDEANLLALDKIIGRPVLLKICFSTGLTKLIGNPDNGAKLVKTYQVGAKSTGSQFEFTCSTTERSCWLNP